jgi:hypothetical protein
MIRMLWPRTMMFCSSKPTSPSNFPCTESHFSKWRERRGIGQIIDAFDALDVLLRHGSKNVASDAAEAVDAVVCHKEFAILGFRMSIAARAFRARANG